MLMSFPFSCCNRDALPCIGVCDGQVLISISEVLGDAFREGVEWAAEEDVVGGIWHDLHLEINVNVVEGEADISEVAVVSVIVELAASIFSTRSTCKLLLNFSHITLFIPTI
jgi:hypothetical protein